MRVHGFKNRVSVVKYSKKEQPPISLTENYWSSIQNNNTNAYNLSIASGMINNNNNKNSALRVRAYFSLQEQKYPLTFESIIDAYYNCRANKKRKNDCVRFSYNKETQLTELFEQISRGEYQPYRSKTFIVSYPTYREVFAADFRDRIVHHWIAIRLEPLLEEEFIDDTYNCRKGKGTSYAIKRCSELFQEKSNNFTKEAYIMKWDLKGYFMSINKNILWEKVEKLINEKYHEFDKPTLLYLLKKTILERPQDNCVRTCPIEEWKNLQPGKSLFKHDKNTGIPIGNLTSQLLANYYLSEIDNIMKQKYSGYCRYVDDCWIISDNKKELKEAFKLFKQLLVPLKCKVHPNKFYLQSIYKGVSIVGAMVKPHRIYIGKRVAGRAFSRITTLSKNIKNKLNLEKLIQSTNSYFGLMKNMFSRNIRVRIMKSIKSELWYSIASLNNGTKIKISKYYGNK